MPKTKFSDETDLIIFRAGYDEPADGRGEDIKPDPPEGMTIEERDHLYDQGVQCALDDYEEACQDELADEIGYD